MAKTVVEEDPPSILIQVLREVVSTFAVWRSRQVLAHTLSELGTARSRLLQL